jgi:hypothetical protein
VIVLSEADQAAGVDDQLISLIAELREELEAIMAQLTPPVNPTQHLTVEQLAQRLGVARSTVYAHWREWGGYKLGRSQKAPIRFDSAALSMIVGTPTTNEPPPAPTEKKSSPRPKRRRGLLRDDPRFAQSLDRLA